MKDANHALLDFDLHDAESATCMDWCALALLPPILSSSSAVLLFCFLLSLSRRYVIASLEGVWLRSFFLHGDHALTWRFAADWTAEEKEDFQLNGFRVFLFESGVIGALEDAVSFARLFYPSVTKETLSPDMEARSADFFAEHMGIKMALREGRPVNIPDESLVQSGDYFAVLRLDGPPLPSLALPLTCFCQLLIT